MRNGFSLIELLVVIAILGIISAVGLTVYNDFLTVLGTLKTRDAAKIAAEIKAVVWRLIPSLVKLVAV